MKAIIGITLALLLTACAGQSLKPAPDASISTQPPVELERGSGVGLD